MTQLSLVKDFIKANSKYVLFPFYKDGTALADGPMCGMSLRAAGSMRFRWNEENPVRDAFFKELCQTAGEGKGAVNVPVSVSVPVHIPVYMPVPVQLEHTHIVFAVDGPQDTRGKIGDGIITQNYALIPTVTVADCVPIYLWDSKKRVFGIVHSGWKGTGIAADAIKLAGERYGSRPQDFCVCIGPHIGECCYVVNEERAGFFAREFCPECVAPLEEGASVKVNWNNGGGKLYRLSLTKANIASIKKIGVDDNCITICTDCTACSPGEVFGSNRRETAAAGRPDSFTVQAAFIYAPSH